MMEAGSVVALNLAHVRGRIAAVASRCGRSVDDVRLVGVTKYADAAAARALVAAGCLDLGESRPQQLWSKAAELADLPVRWHLVGHLQRNKVRRTVPLAHLIHSLDSPRLAEVLEREAAEQNISSTVLLEVNISGDATKHGLAPDAVAPLLERLSTMSHVRVRGLMAMSHREGGPEVARADFARLRELRDRWRRDLPTSMALDELSMGMSDDFEAAILEGSTIVRIGSALFRAVDERDERIEGQGST